MAPHSLEELWRKFTELSASEQDHFLRAGNAYLIALSMWPDQRTAYLTFLVVACEALKPIGKQYDSRGIYDVVASLLSQSEAKQLFQHIPEEVRNKLLHRGELAAGELLKSLIHDYFADPSFDELLRELSRVCRMCLIEWLCRGGAYELVQMRGTRGGRAKP